MVVFKKCFLENSFYQLSSKKIIGNDKLQEKLCLYTHPHQAISATFKVLIGQLQDCSLTSKADFYRILARLNDLAKNVSNAFFVIQNRNILVSKHLKVN